MAYVLLSNYVLGEKLCLMILIICSTMRSHYMKVRNFFSASMKYLKILEQDALHADTNHNFGLLQVELGLKKEALIFLQTAINTNPNVLQYWITFINTLTKVERFDDARSVLEEAHLFGHKDETLNHLRHNLDLAQRKYEPLIKPDQLNVSQSVNVEQNYRRSGLQQS